MTLALKLAGYKFIHTMFSDLYTEVREIKSERERLGSWSVIDQLRFEGLKDIIENVTDMGLRELVSLYYPWGLKCDLELRSRP